MIGSMEEGSTSASHGFGTSAFQPKFKVFLSHSGAQKGFVEQLCVDLERCDRPPFFDKRRDCLPIGKDFPRLIFEAIKECEVGVVVLSEGFFTSKWPMLELVAMVNVQKRKPSFTILPVLLGLSLSQCLDVANHERWLSLWRLWAECDSRIDLQDWIDALRLFGPTNALKYNFELGEVKYRKEIVEAICRLVLPGTRFEDSHIQGRLRLCQVVHERIKHSKVSSLYGVRIIGLHGFGGIGKSTLCKALCNDIFAECGGKVAHVELGSRSEAELLKDVLQRLTNMNLERLGAMDVDEYRYRLMRDMMTIKVFLTIDNVSSVTRTEALTLLRANYGCGSVVLVTSRSLTELTSLGLLASECMEMPELEMEEARSLFLYHAPCVPSTYLSNKEDHELVSSCVRRCYFEKGDGLRYHYHPLALQTLGEQLGCVGYVPDRWRLLLHELDFLNPFGELQHPVFSILRISFDALNPEDQLLFMDAALFGPCIDWPSKWSRFEWFGMVHGIPVTSVIERLENLKRKSLLEDLGNGFGRIGIHDLWREFARLETKAGKFERRRWTFEWDMSVAFEEACVIYDGRLVNVRQRFSSDMGFMKMEDASFSCFPNVTVLKLHLHSRSLHELDLRGLKHLKSLDVGLTSRCQAKIFLKLLNLDVGFFGNWFTTWEPWKPIVKLSSLMDLGCLRWHNSNSADSPCVDEISHLTNLQVLDLHGCDQLPDLSSLTSLRAVCLYPSYWAGTISGFTSNHTNLQFLDLTSCQGLQSCPGLGELIALQELCLNLCFYLEEVPNLQKLTQLRKLGVSNCKLLQDLPGLGDLVSLVELDAGRCWGLEELSNMHNLINLRKLNLRCSKFIKSLPGLNELVGLQYLDIKGCQNLTQLPDMLKLTNLQDLGAEMDPRCMSFDFF